MASIRKIKSGYRAEVCVLGHRDSFVFRTLHEDVGEAVLSIALAPYVNLLQHSVKFSHTKFEQPHLPMFSGYVLATAHQNEKRLTSL